MKANLLLFFLLNFSCISFCQEIPDWQEEVNETFAALNQQLGYGDTAALRSIGAYLDDDRPFIYDTGHGSSTTKVSNMARELLHYKVEFILSDTLRTIDFYQFLDDPSRSIEFSPFIGKFIDMPLENRSLTYRLREKRKAMEQVVSLDELREEIASQLDRKRYYDITKTLEKVGVLGTPEAFQYLQECAEGRHWGKGVNDRENQIYSSICYALRHFETLEAARLIVDIWQQHELYNPAECVIALSKITNVDYMMTYGDTTLPDLYDHLLDSLPDLKLLKQAGYQLAAEYTANDFTSEFDYLAQLVLDSRDFWWINYHAIQDLLALKDPRALQFVGTQLKRGTYVYNDYFGREEYDVVTIMEAATGLTLEVQDRDSVWGSQYQDQVALTNYALYWMQHYDDFVWNDTLGHFQNIWEEILPIDTLSSYFELLSSPIDSVALSAFMILTEQDPAMVESKLQQYRFGLFNGMNNALPSFSKRFLPQLTHLTKFCREQDVNYKLTTNWIKVVDSLEHMKDDASRYQLENEVLDQLSLDEVTPLEYYMIVYEDKYFAANTSVSRILDKWYSQHWDQIVDDSLQLRLYLKKAWHFDHLGIIGNVNKYVLKFSNARPETIARLKQLSEVETDQFIRSKAVEALGLMGKPSMNRGEGNGRNLDGFLVALDTAALIDFKQIHLDTTMEEYSRLFAALETDDLDRARAIVELIRQHLHIEMTPFLLAASDNLMVLDQGHINRHDVTGAYHSIEYDILVADKMVAYLEHLHDYVYPAPPDPAVEANFVSSSASSEAAFRKRHLTSHHWEKLNATTAGNFRNWSALLYQKEMEEVLKADTLLVEQVNVLLQSKQWKASHWPNIIDALPKVRPTDHLSRLKRPQGRSLPISAMPHFLAANFNPKDIANVSSLFYKLPVREGFSFLQSLMQDFTTSQKGFVFYKLMWNTHFKNWVKEGLLAPEQAIEVSLALKTYLTELREDSFEKGYVLKFIEQLEGTNLPVKLRFERMLADTSQDWETAIKGVLSAIAYDQLGVVLDLYDRLPLGIHDRTSYITQDWGIPLRTTLTDTMLQQLRLDYARFSELELYEHYLDLYGIPFRKNETLDYEAIYDMLEFDIVDGFVGGGGGRRRGHTYALIRVLELQFGTELNTEEKFNNSLNHHSFSTTSRARKWQNFLQEQGYVTLSTHYVPGISNLDDR